MQNLPPPASEFQLVIKQESQDITFIAGCPFKKKSADSYIYVGCPFKKKDLC